MALLQVSVCVSRAVFGAAHEGIGQRWLRIMGGRACVVSRGHHCSSSWVTVTVWHGDARHGGAGCDAIRLLAGRRGVVCLATGFCCCCCWC